MQLVYEAYYRNLGQNIAFYRKRQRLTQLELSEAADISRNHLSRLCRISGRSFCHCRRSGRRTLQTVPEQRLASAYGEAPPEEDKPLPRLIKRIMRKRHLPLRRMPLLLFHPIRKMKEI